MQNVHSIYGEALQNIGNYRSRTAAARLQVALAPELIQEIQIIVGALSAYSSHLRTTSNTAHAALSHLICSYRNLYRQLLEVLAITYRPLLYDSS